jgi:hypothetical protein
MRIVSRKPFFCITQSNDVGLPNSLLSQEDEEEDTRTERISKTACALLSSLLQIALWHPA